MKLNIFFWRTPKPASIQGPVAVDHHPIYRFKCIDCGAEKDQGTRRANRVSTKCICGGVARRVSGELPSAEKPRWVDEEGNKVGVLAAENRALVDSVYSNMGAS